MDENGFGKACARKIRRREDGGIRNPLHGTWMVDFMTRQDAGKFLLARYLSDKQVSWKGRRQMRRAVVETTPTGSWLDKIGKLPTVG